MIETAEMERAIDTEAEETSRIYEIGYMLMPTKKEEEIEVAVAQIRAMIESAGGGSPPERTSVRAGASGGKAGGKFLAEGAPTLQRLAYLISVRGNGKRVDYDRGYFGWIKFEAPTEVVAPLEKALREMDGVMRSILFRTVREETRARFKTASIREVRRGDILKAAPRAEEVAAPVSEEDLDKAIEGITAE